MELWRRDRVLATAGWILVGLLAAMACVAPFDPRLVTGINPWIKPIKFGASIALYLWTLAWLIGYLGGPRWVLQTIRWSVSVIMVGEFLCVAVQAARGTTSHWNNATPFDSAIWTAMSIGIMLNTLLDILVLALFLRPLPRLSRAYRWGIRLGLAVFILGGIEGLWMVFSGAHTVGGPDGGPGLPLLNWSTRAGDLRVAHLLGLHAVQILPLVGHAAGTWSGVRDERRQVALVLGFALLYLLAGSWQFLRALHGTPFARS